MAVAFVQSASNAAKAVSSLAKAFASNNTLGNMLVLGVGVWKSGGAFNDPTVTDTLGNTWKLLLSTPRNISCAYIFVAYNCAVGANTVTVNVGTSSDIDMSIHEYSGCAHVTAMDQIAGGSSPSASSILAGTVTTQYANEVIFSFCYDQSHGAQTFTPSASWTLRQQTTNPDGASSASFDRIASSTGSFTNTISVSGGSSTGLHGLIVTFADTSSTDALVQIASNSGIVSSLAAAFQANNTAGNLLLLAIGRWKTGTGSLGTISSVSDSQGNTWVPISASPLLSQVAHGESQSHLYACASCAAGANTVTVVTSTSEDLQIIVLEYTPNVMTNAVANSAVASPVASGNVNAQSGLAFAMAYNQSTSCGNYSDSSGTGWKQRVNRGTTFGTTLSTFDQVLPSTATIESTMSTNVGSSGLHVIVSGKAPVTQPIMQFLIS